MKKTEFKQTEIGKIPEEWKLMKIGDCIELAYGKGLKESERKKGDVVVFGSNGPIGFHKQALVKGPGIIVGRKGSVGEVIFTKKDFWPIDTTYYVIIKQEESLEFWYYFLKNLKLKQMNSHSAVPGLNRTDVYKLVKKIPKLEEQVKIAKILSDLDSKIELNQQTNQTLEAIAQALFKHWFVDFEFPNEEGKPYKSSGGKMVDSELGKIPKGWKIGSLRNIANVNSGRRPSRRQEIKTDQFSIPLIGASSIMGFVKKYLYKGPILVIGRVGTHGIVQRIEQPSFPSDNTLVINSRFYEFVYQVLKKINYRELNVGTTQPLITQKAIKNHEIIIPDEKILTKFEQVSSTLFNKIFCNNLEKDSLSKFRDSLLPKLMSGQIRVEVS